MNFYIPTQVFDEENCVLNHAKELCSLGTKALIITGKHSSRVNGALDDTLKALKAFPISSLIFDDIEPNPSVETISKAVRAGIAFEADFVIGVGGGSPLDASKAIALMLANPDKSEEILFQNEDFPHLPVACIPTTAGTGSEVTPYAILTLHKEKTKRGISHRIFPTYAFCDAKYLKTSSRSGLINTAVDTLAHLAESYLNTNSALYNHIFSEKGLALWGSIKDALEKNELTDEVYHTLMYASTLGGMTISHTGTSLPHGLSYPITYGFDVPHGKAVGMFLGGFVECYPDKEAKDHVLSLLGFSNTKELKSYLYRLLELDKLSLPESIIETAFQEVLSNPGKLKNFPCQADYALMEKIACQDSKEGR